MVGVWCMVYSLWFMVYGVEMIYRYTDIYTNAYPQIQGRSMGVRIAESRSQKSTHYSFHAGICKRCKFD